MAPSSGDLSLVADIGGTNTRVALARGRAVLGDTVRRYANADFPDIVAVLSRFVSEEGVAPSAACVAAAGPVRDGAVQMTNIAHWPVIDGDALKRATGAGVVVVLNDLQAQGHALGHVDPGRTRAVISAPTGVASGATQLVIGVGTGFNAAPVLATEGGRLIPPSESGHVDLPVGSDEEARLAAWLRQMPGDHGFASVEDVLSGRGVEHVHAWLGDEEGEPGRLSAAEIMARAVGGADARALRTVGVLARALGRVAGNLSLIHLPFGGVWLVGGVARALAPMLAAHGFVEAFRAKGRFDELMDSFGVSVVEDDYAALTGSASHLVDLLGR